MNLFRQHLSYLLPLFIGGMLTTMSSCDRPEPPPPTPENEPYDFNLNEGFKRLVGNLSDNTPENNPTTVKGVELGRYLFYDKRLSANNTIACASCHKQEFAFSDTRRFSPGFEGQPSRRQSMPLFNLRWTPRFFWDARAATLEEQVLIPIQDQIEMGLTLDEMVNKLEGIEMYDTLFFNAFGDESVTVERVSKGLAQFLRSIVSQDSKYDRAVAEGYRKVFTEQEYKGFQLFEHHVDPDPNNVPNRPGVVRGANCNDCHTLETANLSNFQVTNNGLDSIYDDKGYGEIDGADKWQATFKTSTLRNIALTPPYMHDGRFETLEEVVDHYDTDIVEHQNLGRDLVISGNTDSMRLDLTNEEKKALLAFLHTLTDETFIQNEQYSNPFE